MIRGRIPPNLADSQADVQAFVAGSVNVTSRVADQLRSLSCCDVAKFGPHSKEPVGNSITIADCLELRRSPIVTVLSVGLGSDVGDDSACPAQVAAISPSFTTVAAPLRTHVFNDYTNLYTPAVGGVMCASVQPQQPPVGAGPRALWALGSP